MARADRLSENALVQELANLDRAVRDFAGRQPIGIVSGLITYEVKSADTWDLVFTVADDSETNVNRLTTITVDYTGDGSQLFPNVRASGMLRVNGEGSANAPTVRLDGYYAWTDSEGRYAGLRGDWGTSQPIYWSDELRSRFTFQIETRKQVMLYFKTFIRGSSPGSITVTRTTT